MKRLAATLLTACLVTACGDAQQRFDPLPRDAVVLAFGDSVTHGTGAGKGEDYPSRLAERTGWRIVNAGIPGDTAQEAKRRIEQALREASPDLVIVELGGNDFLRRRPANLVKEDLREIVHAVKAYGAITVLVGVPELSLIGAAVGRLSDSGIYEELAEEEQALLIGGVFSGVLSDDDLRADRIHPNADGYRVMADDIADALADAGLFTR